MEKGEYVPECVVAHHSPVFIDTLQVRTAGLSILSVHELCSGLEVVASALVEASGSNGRDAVINVHAHPRPAGAVVPDPHKVGGARGYMRCARCHFSRITPELSTQSVAATYSQTRFSSTPASILKTNPSCLSVVVVVVCCCWCCWCWC